MREDHLCSDEIPEGIAMKIRVLGVTDQRPVEIELAGVRQLQGRVCDHRLAQRCGFEHGAVTTHSTALGIGRAESTAPDDLATVDYRQRQARNHRAVHQCGQSFA